MNCSQCGNDVAEGLAVCPSCGAQLDASAPPAMGNPPPPGTSTSGVPPVGMPTVSATGSPTPAPRSPGSMPAAFSFDAKRWSQNDRITGVATLVLFISLFLPWFGVNFGFGSVTVNGLWHGWMYIVLILSLAVMVYLLAHAGFEKMPFKIPTTHEQLLLIGTGISFVLTLLAFVFKPGGSAVGWRFGAFVGLAAAVVAAAPLGIPAIRARRAGRS